MPYIELVFVLETTIRALRSNPFLPRSKPTVVICLLIIGTLLLTNFLVEYFSRAPDYCLRFLSWKLEKYAAGCFVVLLLISVTQLICVVNIFVRLKESNTTNTRERVAASRMMCYVAAGILSNVRAHSFHLA